MANAKYRFQRFVAMALAFVLLLGVVPPMSVDVAAAADETFTTGAVYLDADDSGKEIVIQNGVFSVTVNGATDITIIFENVTIDRRSIGTDIDALNGQTIPNLYYVSQQLGATGQAQVCPFLITGNAEVTALFRGTCVFYAGTNDSTVSNADRYTAQTGGCGFAGIQVQSGSTLIIDDAMDLTVFGGVQHSRPEMRDVDGDGVKESAFVPGTNTLYSDALRANKDITVNSVRIYDDPYDAAYKGPNNRDFDAESGGAGIGGGAWFNTTSSASGSYVNGTPGTIIINKGNIEVWGGVQAAGIGGGVNSAATTGMIQINGGNIIAHGGRFGAGIGDGDSVNGNTSTQYRDAHSVIEVNGGNLTVYGGVASPGIGTSDEVSHGNGFGVDVLRDMEISINGGFVNAFSGFPKEFSGSYPDDAPAAIGAGSLTKLPANSIYISSASTQLDASFSNYAITENGSDGEAVPTINVDSDGYLFLLRMGNYHSTQERKLELYLPLTITNPNNGEECLIYEDQSKLTSAGEDVLYYVGEEHVYNANWEIVPADADELEHITVYIDPERSEKIETLEFAYYFRSVAITLPHPSLYGGIYALAVPTDGITGGQETPAKDDFISITLDAREQGTQSGVVQFPSSHNLGLDNKAAPFIDLDVNGNATTNGLIGDSYVPNVYAYTVYIDANSDSAELYALWKDSSTEVYLDDVLKAKNNDAANHELTLSIDMTGVTQKNVRLKKKDGTNSFGAISYKITIIKKGEYLLKFDDADKVYDGIAVSMTPQGVFMPTDLYAVDVPDASVDKTPTTLTPQNENYGWKDGEMYLTSTGNNSWNTTYYTVKVSTCVEVSVVSSSSDKTVVNYILHLKLSNGQNTTYSASTQYSMGYQVLYGSGSTVNRSVLTADPAGSGSGRTWINLSNTTRIGNQNVINSNGELYITASLGGTNSADGPSTISLAYGTNTNSISTSKTLLSIGQRKTGVSTVNGKTTAENNAQAAVEQGAFGGVFPYETYTLSGTTQALTVSVPTVNVQSGGMGGMGGWGTTTYSDGPAQTADHVYSVGGNKTLTASGRYEIRANSYTLSSLPTADLEKIQYTFTKLTDADGEPVVEAPTSVAPKDAGTYRVDGLLQMTSYNAQGSLEFVISKRPITAVQIDNWLLYITSSKLATYDGIITDPGDITIDNVVAGETVSMAADAGASAFYYRDKEIGYAPDKIAIKEPWLVGETAVIANYYIKYSDAEKKEVHVFGQIAYDMTGAMFKKAEDGLWRKYLNADLNVQIHDGNADYQSPKETDTSNGAYLSHAQYVLTRTENDDNARYAIDIEYGALSFSFYRSRWNVNSLEYEENLDSRWDGNDGTNNKISVINYSDTPIQYQISVEIFFRYAPTTQGSSAGISAKVTAGTALNSAELNAADWNDVAAATPGDHSKQGTAATDACYVQITGTPQHSDATGLHIGNVTLSFRSKPKGGS